MVISRSSGTHVGHWLGDNTSKWEHLKLNVIGLLEYNLFGYSCKNILKNKNQSFQIGLRGFLLFL